MERHYPAKLLLKWQCRALLAGLMVLTLTPTAMLAQTDVFSSLIEIEPPVGRGAQEPFLFAMDDGRILMSWTEPSDKGFAVKTVIGDKTGWSEPRTAADSANLFVNWADFPSVAAFGDGTLAVHWLMENVPSSYDYDVNIALSANQGRTWGDVIVPHLDRSQRQHGFATLLPVAQDQLLAIWLDGGAYDLDATGAAHNAFTNAAQLRATTIGSDGNMSVDILLDQRTCTCCQTSAAVTDDGTVLVVYRDRTAEEIRDISLVRLINGAWSDPATIHSDGWEISGCPVNGPAIDAQGERAVVAWFTAAQDVPIVNVAFSPDAGETFGGAIRINQDEAAGRVDVIQLDDASALVSWMEWRETGAELLVCRARPMSGCGDTQVITLDDATEMSNFPRMVLAGDGVYIAWTQFPNERSANPNPGVTIKMVFATLKNG